MQSIGKDEPANVQELRNYVRLQNFEIRNLKELVALPARKEELVQVQIPASPATSSEKRRDKAKLLTQQISNTTDYDLVKKENSNLLVLLE